ncbi:unnamed protein product [Coccothraustes coccothraustes]
MSAAGAGSGAAPPLLILAGGAGQPRAARAEKPGGGEHGWRFLCGAHGDRTTLKEFGGVLALGDYGYGTGWEGPFGQGVPIACSLPVPCGIPAGMPALGGQGW